MTHTIPKNLIVAKIRLNGMPQKILIDFQKKTDRKICDPVAITAGLKLQPLRAVLGIRTRYNLLQDAQNLDLEKGIPGIYPLMGKSECNAHEIS